MIRANFAALAVAASIAFVSTPGATQTVSQAVRYADLDLGSVAGRHTLDLRIAGAIRHICGIDDTRDFKQVSDVRQCRASARSDAAAKLAQVLNSRAQLAALRDGIVVASR